MERLNFNRYKYLEVIDVHTVELFDFITMYIEFSSGK